MRRLLPLLPLAACAQAPAAPDPTTWIGRTEAELVAALGVPSRVHEADGRRFLAYDVFGGGGPSVVPSIGVGVGRSSGGWGSSTGFGTGLGLSFGGGGWGGGYCTTSFEIAAGRVATGMRQGPGCG
jgi:hypothetical protein